MKKIVIIGGGFAGINLIEKLAGDNRFHITLVDRNNYNFFPPLLYQVATGFLEVSHISYPFRKVLRGKENVSFRLAEFVSVKQEENKVVLSNGELDYDYLVFATGTETNFFGMENVKKNAIPMKTINDAVSMRNVLLQRMEQASVIDDLEERRKLLSVVVVGGGPTGVEVSGMFAEMRQNVILKDYPEFKGSGAKIYLVDGGNSVLAAMSEKSQKYTGDTLRKMGVDLIFGANVKDYDNGVVYLTNGETIEAGTVIWGAGVISSVFDGIARESYGRGRRLLVDGVNKVAGTSNIYAIGDTCLMEGVDSAFQGGHPQMAQVAIQQGANLAGNFAKMESGSSLKTFSYHDKGSMAIIGRNKAVTDLPGGTHFKGFIAWFMWLFVHLISLITFKNKLKTLYTWSVTYFTKDESLRFIIRPDQEKKTE